MTERHATIRANDGEEGGFGMKWSRKGKQGHEGKNERDRSMSIKR